MYTKTCEICGKQFETKSKMAKYCKGPHINICPICGNHEEVYPNQSNKFINCNVACSYKCRAKKTRETSLKKYGCLAPGNNPEAREKSKRTMIEKYGSKYTLQSKELSDRVRHTLIEKYGVDNPQKNKQIHEKTLESQRNNEGGILPFNTERSYKKRAETLQKKYESIQSKLEEDSKYEIHQDL